VLADTLDHVEQVSRRKGLNRTDLALLTDGLRAEREQGITIDVAYRYFATPARKFILADCPGHVQYTPQYGDRLLDSRRDRVVGRCT
jgi:sulfate adenylyltransferase subunit 1